MDSLNNVIAQPSTMELEAAVKPDNRDPTTTDERLNTSDLSASWMSQLLAYIGDRTLKTICVPRTHDAATYPPIVCRRMGSPSTVITQSVDILSQLNLGVRMFDLRPCLVKDQFVCGHYQYIKPDTVPSKVRGMVSAVLPDLLGWYSGGEGATLSDIIKQVNEFTKSRNEVVILEISHTFNFDREVQDSEWAHLLNQAEWDRLTLELSQLNHLFVSEQGSKASITDIKIRDLIGAGSAAVVVIMQADNNNKLDPKFAGRGFFDISVLDSLKSKHITHEQTPIEAICAFLRDKDHSLLADMVVKFGDQESPYLQQGLYSILDVAQRLKLELLPRILEETSSEDYFNFVSMDNVTDDSLLHFVLLILGKAVMGSNVTLRPRSDGTWEFCKMP